MEEIKTCPFCGSMAELNDNRLCWSVSCTICDATVVGERVEEPATSRDIEKVDWDSVRDTAVTKWNRRVNIETTDLEKFINGLIDGYEQTQECLDDEFSADDNTMIESKKEFKELREKANKLLKDLV